MFLLLRWGSVLLRWTGLVLPAPAQNPARLVYGSAALVASLRGQQSHFATLPNTAYGRSSTARGTPGVSRNEYLINRPHQSNGTCEQLGLEVRGATIILRGLGMGAGRGHPR